MSHTEGEPTKFIRELKDKSSILVFYEDQRYARSLGFLFLDVGLKDNQACLYLSCETISNIEADMTSAGIDIAYFKSSGLRIYSTTNQKKEQIIETVKDFVKNTKNHTSRIIIQHDRFTKEQQPDLLLIEESVQTLFEKHDVSVLNIYNTEFMDNSKFMQQIISMHEYTIFAPDFGKGIVIKIR